MLKKLITAVMRNEKDPELNPIRITSEGSVECTSGVLYGKFDLFADNKSYQLTDDVYMNYKTFNSIIYPLLSENPSFILKNNILHIKSKSSNLKINLSMPFDDYKEALNERRDIANSITKEVEQTITGSDLRQVLYILKENMKVARSLSMFKDLNFVKLSTGKAISFSPISLMAVNAGLPVQIKEDIPGVLVDIIVATEPDFIGFADEFIFLQYPIGEIVCKKLTYDKIDYKHFLEGLEKQASIDFESIDKFWQISQYIESSYWVKNLHIKGKYPNGVIMLKSPTANIKRKIKVTSGQLNISISPKIFKLIYKLELNCVSESDKVYAFMTSEKNIVFIVSKEADVNNTEDIIK